MPSLVNNFTLDSTELTDTYCKLVFKFDVFATSAHIGGYRIYKSYLPNATAVYDRIIINKTSYFTIAEAELTTTDDEFIYFSYYVEPKDFGRILYLSVAPVTRMWVEQVSCDAIPVNIPADKPEDFEVFYDNYTVGAAWSPPTSTLLSNSNISGYTLKKAYSILLEGVFLNDAGNLSHPKFSMGSRIFVADVVKKSYWYGVCVSSGEFLLNDDSQFQLVQDNSSDYDISLNNIRVYMESSFEQIGMFTPNILTAENVEFTPETLQFYAVSGTVGDTEGRSSYFPLYTVALTKVSPYLRSVGNSDNKYMSSSFWRKLKNVLIDQNYYNKQSFDIPHVRGMYAFSGFLGLYNCKVDVFINDVYSTTVLSDKSGSFKFSVHLTKSNSKLQLQARDQTNVGFSIKSNAQIVRLVNIYSFFSALAQEYTAIWEELLLQMSDFSFSTSRPTLLEDKLSPFVGITKDVSEDSNKFTEFIVQVYLAYEYAGYEQSLYMILDAMQAAIDEFDHYEIYFRDSLMDTIQTGYTYAIADTQAVLDRKNYIYGITTANIYGEESEAATLRVDNRWWPTDLKQFTDAGIFEETSTGYYGFNVLAWSGAAGVTSTNSVIIATTSLPLGELGVPYSVFLIARGGTEPYVWTITSGALTNGLSLNSSTGEISGILTAITTQVITVRCADFVGDYFERIFVVIVPSSAVATSLTSAIPVLQSALLLFTSKIYGRNLDAGRPDLGEPTLVYTSHIPVENLVSGVPVLGIPTADTAADLSADSILTGPPVLGITTALFVTSLFAEDIIDERPVISIATAHFTSILAADGIETGIPEMGGSWLINSLCYAENVAAAEPTLGGPVLLPISCVALPIAAERPSVGEPLLFFTGELVPQNLSTGVPVMEEPLMFFTQELVPQNLEAVAPVLSEPYASLTSTLQANVVSSGVPVLGQPAVSITHTLSADSLSSGSSILGQPDLTGPWLV
jgi:hypothetical protein